MRSFWSNWKLMFRTPVLYFWLIFSNMQLLDCLYNNDFSFMEWNWFVVTNVYTFLVMPLAITIEDRFYPSTPI